MIIANNPNHKDYGTETRLRSENIMILIRKSKTKLFEVSLN